MFVSNGNLVSNSYLKLRRFDIGNYINYVDSKFL